MVRRLHHEQIYRGHEVMQKLAQTSVCLCGAGALGSNLLVNLARAGVSQLSVVDKDRVEEHNIGTQVYSFDDVGGLKAEIVRNLICREINVEVQAHSQELLERNVDKLLKNATVVIDTFDNSRSRKIVTDYCLDKGKPCLHAGVNNQYGEVIWNERYRVPSDAGEDICDYPLARNLILLVVAVASESFVRYVATGERENFSITVGDLSINREVDL
jgi:molybdopterin/thiamine biosynthesis adenylyltransferase